jgi:hypothetical protein
MVNLHSYCTYIKVNTETQYGADVPLRHFTCGLSCVGAAMCSCCMNDNEQTDRYNAIKGHTHTFRIVLNFLCGALRTVKPGLACVQIIFENTNVYTHAENLQQHEEQSRQLLQNIIEKRLQQYMYTQLDSDTKTIV